MALARVTPFLKPDNMNDGLAMLKLTDDRLEDLMENDYKGNSLDIEAELFSLRRMVRGCLPVVAAGLGGELDKTMKYLCKSAFAEVPE